MEKVGQKNTIITGSNRGIGAAVLEELASCGYNIWACARKPNLEFEERIKNLSEKYGVWIKPVYFELSNEDEIKAGIKSIMSEKLPIDILVNNAGMPFGGLMTMTPISKLKEVFEVNFFSHILLMQLVARVMMRQKSGCIINMASVGGIETNPGYLAYGSSKAALIWATKCVAKELGPYGVRVNAVAPGFTNTSMGHFNKDEELNKMIEKTSLRRMASPEEIAKGVAYLASDDASFVTGHVLVIDGGRSV
jgi:3-oxoacyl-[acyl-carrier protein] reductase